MTTGVKGRAMIIAWLAMATTTAWGYGGGYHYGSGMMYGGGIFGWLMMILIVVLVVAIGIGLIRWLFADRHRSVAGSPSNHKSALDILEERYARGEIDKNEFEEKRKTLSR